MASSKEKEEAEEFDFDPLAMPGAMPRADMAFEGSAPKTDYTVETEDINTEQAYRMVSKVLNSKKK